MGSNNDPPHLDGDLVLYYHPHNFYSQKILFALNEKNIHFVTYEVDVTRGEQYSQWFLELNPKGEVPVLKNGTLIIPESGRIISYIEANVQGENIPKLLPREINAKLSEKILFFHRKISRLPIGAISMGSFLHTDLCTNPKPPFIGLIRKTFLQTDDRIATILEEYAKINPAHADILLTKAKFQEKKKALISNRDEYLALVEVVNFILTEAETELEKHDFPEMWLCCDQFTIADISLGMLLHRLYCLGFEDYFWKNKRPFIEKYFQRILQRESFQKTLPSTYSTVKTVWFKTPVAYKFGAAAISAAVLLSGIIAQKI